MAEKVHKFKKPRVLSLLLKVMLCYHILAIGIVLGVSLTGSLYMLNDSLFSAFELIQNSLFVVPLIDLVLLLFWVYRSNSNAHTMSTGMEFTPAWAVGWWFVPVAAFVMPYAVVSEIYKVSRNPQGWKDSGNTRIVAWWWTSRVATNIVAIIVNIIEKNSSEPMTFEIAMLLLSLSLISAALTLFIVHKIDAFQNQAKSKIGVEEAF